MKNSKSLLIKSIVILVLAFIMLSALLGCTETEEYSDGNVFYAESESTAVASVEDTEPEETEAVAPETTEPPVTTKAPETTKTPETTKAPETTKISETTEIPETSKAPDTTEAPEMPNDEPDGTEYLLNTNSKKFHYMSCKSGQKTKAENREYFTGTREQVIARGYDPCKNCKP